MKSVSENVAKTISAPRHQSVHAFRNELLVKCFALVLLLFACFTIAARAQSLVHTSSAKSINSNYTLIEMKELNGNPSAVVFAEVSQHSKVKNVKSYWCLVYRHAMEHF